MELDSKHQKSQEACIDHGCPIIGLEKHGWVLLHL
jgi:hypothetical protein